MIGSILPAAVACSEAYGDADEVLLPGEEVVVSRASARRRAEFATVRACARSALRQLGVAPAALVPGRAGAPVWPPRIVGSMTHCAGYRAAAVAEASRFAAIGIDAEPHTGLAPGVLEAVAVPVERDHVRRLIWVDSNVHWDVLLFSAKESVYKACFPLFNLELGFHDVALEFTPATRSFSATVSDPGEGARPFRVLTGRWSVARGLILTAVAVPQVDTSWGTF